MDFSQLDIYSMRLYNVFSKNNILVTLRMISSVNDRGGNPLPIPSEWPSDSYQSFSKLKKLAKSESLPLYVIG